MRRKKRKFRVFVAVCLCFSLVGGVCYFAGGKSMLQAKADSYQEKGAAKDGSLFAKILTNLFATNKDGSSKLLDFLNENNLGSLSSILGDGSLDSIKDIISTKGGSSQLVDNLISSASSWAESMGGADEELEVNDVRKVRNADGNTQFAVSYQSKEDKTPYGYAVLGYDDNQRCFNVDESCIVKGAPDLFSSLMGTVKNLLSNIFGQGGLNGLSGLSSLFNLNKGGGAQNFGDIFKNFNFGNDIFKNGSDYGININGGDGGANGKGGSSIFDIFGNDMSGDFGGGGCNGGGCNGGGNGGKGGFDFGGGGKGGNGGFDFGGFDFGGFDFGGGGDGGNTNGGEFSSVNIFKDAGDISAGNATMLPKFEKKPELLDSRKSEQQIKEYACAVQASTQCAYVEGLTDYNSQLKDTYDRLWSYSRTQETPESGYGGVRYGGTIMADMANAFVKFAKEKGKTGTTTAGMQGRPTVEWFRQEVQQDHPIIFGYSRNGGSAGHCISILGVKSANRGNSSSDYVVVYDSWTSTPKMMNYAGTSFDYKEAASFIVK